MSLIILTKSPALNIFSLETYKKLVRKMFKKNRGPQAVTASVIRGLSDLRYSYEFNPSNKSIKDGSTIWINESIEALRWAISFKRANKMTLLVVGPNLVVTPDEHDGIILNKDIDIILQPSEWTKKLYERYNPTLSSKIKVWPAGVEDPYKTASLPVKSNYFIVYQKNSPQEIFDTVISHLEDKGIPYHVIKYGSFKHEDYLSLLDGALGIIYLSKSESQGLALQEAWIRNTPSLVWNRGFWEFQGNKFEHDLIGSPHLTPESGAEFKSSEDVAQKINLFVEKIEGFNARDYCLSKLSDKVTTRHFLDIISLT